MSFNDISEFLYPSLLKANTAFGPTSLSPFIILVKCKPRKGNFGFPTGYTKWLTNFFASLVNL